MRTVGGHREPRDWHRKTLPLPHKRNRINDRTMIKCRHNKESKMSTMSHKELKSIVKESVKEALEEEKVFL